METLTKVMFFLVHFMLTIYNSGDGGPAIAAELNNPLEAAKPGKR